MKGNIHELVGCPKPSLPANDIKVLYENLWGTQPGTELRQHQFLNDDEISYISPTEVGRRIQRLKS